MPKSKDPPGDFSELRRRAEERLHWLDIPPEELSPDEAARLVHELRVHQIELEMQNEELRLSQARLEESRSKYADLYDYAPVGYLTLDARGRIVEANLTATTFLGEERSRLTGRFFSHFLAEADRLAFHHLITGKRDVPEQRVEVRLEDGNGGLRTVLLDVLLTQDADGREQVRISMTDITELKHTQEELRLHKENLEGLVAQQVVELVEVTHQLRRSREHLQAVIENSPLAVMHLDSYGRVLSWNPAAERMFGWRAAEVVGGPLPTVPDEKQEEFAAIFQKVLQGESLTGLETRRQRKDGAWIEVSLSAAPLRDAQANVSGSVGIVEDITARKRAEAEIHRLASFPRLNPHPVMEIDEQGVVVYANPAALSLAEKLQLPEGIKALVPPDLETLFDEVRRGAPRRHDFDLKLKGLTYAVSLHFPHDLPTARLYALDITERKRSEEALRESEARERARAAEFQTLFDAMPAFVFLAHDPEARRITGNSLVYDILGMPPEGNVSLSAPEEERPRNYQALKDGREIPIEELPVQRAARGEPVRDYELDVVLTGGAKRTLFGNAIPLLDDSGNPRGAVSAFIDITPLKEAEAALLKREAELSSIFAAAPVGIGVVLDRVITEVNERVCQMTGYSPEELLGKSARLFYPTQEEFDRAGQEKYLKIARYDIGTVETRWQRKDGSIIDVLLSSAPLMPGNLSAGVTFTALDITDRRQAEEALRQSEARYRALGELIPFGIWTTNADGACDYVSRSFLEMAGKTLEDVQKFGWTDLLHPEDRKRTLADWRKCIQTGCFWDYEYRFRCKDGRYRTILARGVPLTDSRGRITSWVGINLDISERKEMEEELRRARDELEIRVQERTRELHLAYDQLSREMAEHLETTKRLRESEARFAAFMRHLPGIAVMWDSQGRCLYANEVWEALTGLEQGAWQGKTLDEVWPPEIADKLKQIDHEVLSQGKPVEQLAELKLPGSRLDYLFHRFPILDEGGRPYMVGGIGIDITERRQAEEALAAERQRLFTVLETMPAYVALLAPDYTVPFANQEFYRRFVKPGKDSVVSNFSSDSQSPAPAVGH